ncbi:hypothetical protein [Phenylobacterium aquaticum]|uniref:hypothetical protein n=1 Tax=Phenylobacterium aquaticum TaxID=1763816 RepID=UPI001F5C9864|nr:hypothetical protein [Phenylobacterium aquaticum]MCI3131852.1 hypothetical protein [Phenylobacterium aquaticum]
MTTERAASSAWARVMAPVSTMAARTTRIRARAPCGFSLGARREGALTRPASMAASPTVSCSGEVSK